MARISRNKKDFQKAIDLWGTDFLLDMVGEECIELTKAVFDYKRRKEASFPKLLEEIVDVEIIIEQIKVALLIGTDKNEWLKIKRYKLKRFRERLLTPLSMGEK